MLQCVSLCRVLPVFHYYFARQGRLLQRLKAPCDISPASIDVVGKCSRMRPALSRGHTPSADVCSFDLDLQTMALGLSYIMKQSPFPLLLICYLFPLVRARVEELRMFLENETWELCPVKSNFNISQLHVSKNRTTESAKHDSVHVFHTVTHTPATE